MFTKTKYIGHQLYLILHGKGSGSSCVFRVFRRIMSHAKY